MPLNTWRRITPVEVLRTHMDPESPIPIRSAHGLVKALPDTAVENLLSAAGVTPDPAASTAVATQFAANAVALELHTTPGRRRGRFPPRAPRQRTTVGGVRSRSLRMDSGRAHRTPTSREVLSHLARSGQVHRRRNIHGERHLGRRGTVAEIAFTWASAVRAHG
jgi:hypothetical protein